MKNTVNTKQTAARERTLFKIKDLIKRVYYYILKKKECRKIKS